MAFLCFVAGFTAPAAMMLTNERPRHPSRREGAAPTGAEGGAGPATVPRSRGPRAIATCTPVGAGSRSRRGPAPQIPEHPAAAPPLPRVGGAPLQGDRRRNGVGVNRGTPVPSTSHTAAIRAGPGPLHLHWPVCAQGTIPKGLLWTPHWGGGEHSSLLTASGPPPP